VHCVRAPCVAVPLFGVIRVSLNVFHFIVCVLLSVRRVKSQLLVEMDGAGTASDDPSKIVSASAFLHGPGPRTLQCGSVRLFHARLQTLLLHGWR
jgi:hypothetical protein